MPLVRRMVAEQFPQWAGLPVRPANTPGTVHATFRLGEDMAVRLPRSPGGTGDVQKELKWLSGLAPQLPLPVPVPLAEGRPSERYPWMPAWEAALSAPRGQGPPTWSHGDLLPSNLIVNGGRLSGVVDFGCMGVGDPACDAMPAWTMLSAHGRSIFRDALGVDNASWERARGWALSMAVIALPYYWKRNPDFAKLARHVIGEVLNDR